MSCCRCTVPSLRRCCRCTRRMRHRGSRRCRLAGQLSPLACCCRQGHRRGELASCYQTAPPGPRQLRTGISRSTSRCAEGRRAKLGWGGGGVGGWGGGGGGGVGVWVMVVVVVGWGVGVGGVGGWVCVWVGVGVDGWWWWWGGVCRGVCGGGGGPTRLSPALLDARPSPPSARSSTHGTSH